MSKMQLITKGFVKDNPTFVLILGMCPTLATTTSAINGLSMGLATLFVLVLSNMAISLVAKVTPDKVHIPVYIVVIATFVTVLQLLMQAYTPGIYSALGVFIPLIVVNCIIIGRAEAFSSKYSVKDSFFDGVFQGLGYTAVLIAMCLIRELLGSGTIGGGLLNGASSFLTLDGTGAGLRIFPEEYAARALTLPFGGFLTLGCLYALMQHLLSRHEEKKAAKEKEVEE